MARAQYLHVLTDPTETGIRAIVGIFTVKHEMESWIKLQIKLHDLDRGKLVYTRMLDGKYKTFIPNRRLKKFPVGTCQLCGDPDPSCICYAR